MNIKSFAKHLARATMLTSVASAAVVTQVHAQDFTTGVFTGKVTDTSGNPVSGALVTVVSEDQGFTRTANTGASGEYRVPRLAIGNYKVTVTKNGFEDVSASNIRVTTATDGRDFRMPAAGSNVMDVITVTASAVSTDDFAATTGGLTVDVESLLARAPIQRDLTAVTLLAPGTIEGDSAFGNLASFSGSSVGENVYYINGMNVSNFRNFTDFTQVPFEAIQTIDVKTGGYQAEFGRSTGGVTNIVTKSGTNEFKFGANVYWEPDALREAPDETYASANALDVTNELDYNFYASGPIIKDRVFFYALFNPYNEDQEDYFYQRGEGEFLKEDSTFWFGKIDVNIADGHRLELTGFSDEAEVETSTYDWDADTNVISGDARKSTEFKGGETYSARYTGVFTDWFTLSALYGETEYNRTTNSDLDSFPVVYDNRDPAAGFVPLGNWANFLVDTGKDKREMFRVDADFYANFFGEHNIRVGIDSETLTATAVTGLSGGNYYLYRTDASGDITGTPGQEYVRVRDYSVGGDFESKQTAFYIQDSWSVTDKLTLQVGLRNETYENLNADGETFVEQDNQWQPRLGATYDLFGDGKSKLFGFYGKYSLPIAANTNIRLAGGETYIHSYYDFTSIDPTTDAPVLGTQYARVDTLSDGSIPDPRELKSDNLEPFYANEYILGYEQVLPNEWLFSARGIYRNLESVIEDSAVDAGVISWCEERGIAGCEDNWSGFHHYVLVNPGSDLVYFTDEIPGSEGEYTRVEIPASELGYPEAEREYKALELKLEKPFEDGWGFNASYTYSTIRGNYEGAVKSDLGQDDAGLTVDFDQPGFVDGSYGPSPNEREHTFKFFGSYELAEGLVLGASGSIQAPRKFGCLGHHPTDEFAVQYGADSWYCVPNSYDASADADGDWRNDSVLTPRGSQLEADWLTRLDLGLKWSPGIETGDLTFSLDVYNILNSQAVTDLNETGESGQGVVNPNYGRPTLYQTPRSVRLGASFRF